MKSDEKISGKRWVECTNKGQISIPDSIDPETQVFLIITIQFFIVGVFKPFIIIVLSHDISLFYYHLISKSSLFHQ